MSDEFVFDSELPVPVAKILGGYRKSLFAEMYYLRDNGGRRYKVTDGKLIGKTSEGYAYSFDMEAELFLSEDSPITVTVGAESVEGSVLACEDFQIIAILESNVGGKVASAFISVEPWKLLESLNERLSHISMRGNPIAVKLLQEGPTLATRSPIEGVDAGQDAAMEHALEDDITVIWGPPGTGKTHTMAEIAIRYLSMGKTVLAVSHSNISVDGIVLKTAELMREKGTHEELKRGKVMRFGHVRDEALRNDHDVVAYNFALKSNPKAAKRLKELTAERDSLLRTGNAQSPSRVKVEQEIKKIKKSVAEGEKRCVERAQMVATTASRLYANKLFEGKSYDLVMFDEVSMAYVPQVVCAAMFARERLVCVGDFRQLAPIAQGKASKEVLSRDIFWYLGICDKVQRAHYHPWLVMLDEQRRMHPGISAFPSKAFYGGLLRNHESVVDDRDAIADGTPFPEEPACLIDLGGTYCVAGKNSDNSRFNILSAAVSFATAITAEMDNGKCGVGVIAPYVAQVRLVRAMLQDYRSRKKETGVSCATVHQFQGSERDVIVMDLVESLPAKKPGILMSDNDNGNVDRLVNVAVTRARGKLVTVANRRFWLAAGKGSKNSFAGLVKHHEANDCVCAVADDDLAGYLSDIEFGPNIKLVLDQNEATRAFIHDVDRAALRIALSIPDGKLIDDFADEVCRAIEEAKYRGVDVTMKCRDWEALPENWKSFGWRSDDADCPITVIDDQIVWYGMPLSRGLVTDGKGSGSVVVLQTPLRIKGECTVDMIKSLTDIESKVVNGQKKTLRPRIGAAEQGKDGTGSDGLALYVKQKVRCPRCKSPMLLKKGFKSGKFFLGCSKCDETKLLEKDFVNHYICAKQVKCPKCAKSLHTGLTARVGKCGIYVNCDRDHIIKPDEI